MTRNQIEYQKLRETQRANRANERLAEARDIATKRIGLDTLQETQRHNQQVELQARDNLAEQYRSNVAQLQELQRSHLAAEGLGRFQAQIASDQQIEQARHNAASEAIDQYKAQVSQYAADVGAQSHISSAGIAAAASQYASDNALLAKQLTLDLEKYGIDVQTGLRSAELKESKRANIARETETSRSNRANEGIRTGSLMETVRNNLVSRTQNAGKIAADVRLRGEQNAISRFNAETQRKTADANISLVPSQEFRNVTGALSDVVKSGSLISALIGGK